MMNKILTIFALLFTLSVQGQSYAIKQNSFPEYFDQEEWVGTNIFLFVEKELLVHDTTGNNLLIIDGYVVYRKYFVKENRNHQYWDIEFFTDIYGNELTNCVVLGFKLDE